MTRILAILSILLMLPASAGQAQDLGSIGGDQNSRVPDLPGVAPPSEFPDATITDITTVGSVAHPVAELGCATQINIEVDERLPPSPGACDAPIDVLINTMDQVAVAVGEKCFEKLNEKLPDYAKDLRVISALVAANPLALSFALGAAAQDDLVECGVDGVVAGVPTSDAVRADLDKVYATLKTSKEFLDLRENMEKLLKLQNVPADAIQTGGEFTAASLGVGGVEGLGNEIADLGKKLEEKYKDRAKIVTTFAQGADGLEGLLNTALASLDNQDATIAQELANARQELNTCQTEAADRRLVSATARVERAVQQSRQALADARELRICTYDLIEKQAGSLQAVDFLKANQGLLLERERFFRLEQEIARLDQAVRHRANFASEIAGECRAAREQRDEVDALISEHAQLIGAAKQEISECNCGGSQLSRLTDVEQAVCKWRLPHDGTGQRYSQALTEQCQNLALDPSSECSSAYDPAGPATWQSVFAKMGIAIPPDVEFYREPEAPDLEGKCSAPPNKVPAWIAVKNGAACTSGWKNLGASRQLDYQGSWCVYCPSTHYYRSGLGCCVPK